jgi:hypothetical protein
LLLLLTTACSHLLSVDAPDVVQPSDLANPSGLSVLRAGAIARVDYAFNGTNADGRGIVGMTALMSDEFTSALRTNNGSDDAADKRQVLDPGVSSPYAQLQQAYVSLLTTLDAYHHTANAPQKELAELFALQGYIEVWFAEDFCSGVPLSTLAGSVIAFGGPVTSADMLARALASFDSSLAGATASSATNTVNLARVGRGRVLVDMNRLSDAEAAVASVPTSFVYTTQQANGIQQNGVYFRMFSSRYWSVSDREGGTGLNFLSAKDPRVPTVLIGPSTNDGVTPVYGYSPYATPGATIVVASGTEARLIAAESRLAANDPAGALLLMNQLRATMSGLTPLTPVPDAASAVDQLFRERAFWLFATGHRLGDLRRLVRQYGRKADAVFPSGAYADRASVYGTATNFTPDAGELNNPAYTGCADRTP